MINLVLMVELQRLHGRTWETKCKNKKNLFIQDKESHQPCYIKSLMKPLKSPSKDDLQNNKAENVLGLFEYRII